ncbi:MAG: alpha/beta hydrolase [Vicinamibacterales bacterium]
MTRRFLAALLTAGVFVTAGHDTLSAQLSPTAEWAAHAQNAYQILPNVTYLTANGFEAKLDVYRRRDVQAPQPTLVFYHGGGWIGGTKEASFMSVMPWLEMGWNVVNVEYRMARVSLAPAAVEDAQCALKFVVNRAKDYNIDTSKIVLSGESAGGHLSLTTGMIPASVGFTSLCAGGGFTGNDTALPKVAAIINWYGITDVNAMLTGGPDARAYAVQWLGSAPNRDAIAKSVSPLTYVRADLPPILSIQGDADPIVPYSQNTRLLDALKKAGAKAELFTIPGGGHGNFKPAERSAAYVKIREFLKANGL